LPIRERILSEVVRRIGPWPPGQRGVVENWPQLSLEQGRGDQQEEGRRRIGYVHGRDTAVGEVLFGKVERRAIQIRGQLVRGHRLAVCENSDISVLGAAGPLKVGPQLAIELFAARGYLIVLRGSAPQQVRGPAAVAPPPRPQVSLKVLNGKKV